MSPNDPPNPSEAEAILGVFRQNKELFEELVTKVEKAWDDLCAGVDALLRHGEHLAHSDSAWSSFIEWIADLNPFQQALVELLEDIRTKFGELREKVDRLLPMFRKVAERSVPVLSLCDHSFTYLSHVFAPLGDLYNRAGDLNPNAAYWDGPTKTYYVDQVVADQQAALDRVTDHTQKLSSWLVDTAAKNTDYMVTLVHNVTFLANDLVEVAVNVAATAEDFASVYFAIDHLAELAGNTVQAILDQTAELMGFLVGAVKGIQELAVLKYEHRDLPAGGWPQSVANR